MLLSISLMLNLVFILFVIRNIFYLLGLSKDAREHKKRLDKIDEEHEKKLAELNVKHQANMEVLHIKNSLVKTRNLKRMGEISKETGHSIDELLDMAEEEEKRLNQEVECILDKKKKRKDHNE